jgi:beta-galactosidase
VKIVTRELADKLTKYVSGGGVLVLGAQAGLKDINLHIVERTPPGLLARLAGIEIEDWTTLGAKEIRGVRMIGGGQIALSTFVERLRPSTAETIGRWIAGDSLLSDAPAVTVNKFGKGRVYYAGGYCPAAAVDSLVDFFIAALDLSMGISAPGEVEIILRGTGKRRYIVVLNHSSESQRVSGDFSGKEIISGKRVDGEMVLPGFGVAVLRVN